MSYRPICDTWLLARSKVKYYGAYPAGFVQRARDLLGATPDDAILHVCGGMVKDYPFRGVGPNDRTVDLNPAVKPDYVQDVRDPLPAGDWRAVLIDRPYTEDDADHYLPGRDKLPNINDLVKNALTVSPKVGVLDYIVPRCPKNARFVACVGVVVGFGNRIRVFTVFERLDARGQQTPDREKAEGI